MIIDAFYGFLQARKASRQLMEPMTSEEFIDFAEEQQMAVKLLRDLKVKYQQLQNDHNTVVRDKAALETELRLEMKSKVFFFSQYIWIHFLTVELHNILLRAFFTLKDTELQNVRTALQSKHDELQIISEALSSATSSNAALKASTAESLQKVDELKATLQCVEQDSKTGTQEKDKQIKSLELEVNKNVNLIKSSILPFRTVEAENIFLSLISHSFMFVETRT
jgi:hypothetical protein